MVIQMPVTITVDITVVVILIWVIFLVERKYDNLLNFCFSLW
jgi:hypothetical protein